jgi:hypothetical protein
MTKIFHVVTGNYLPASKRNFQTIEEAVKHIQLITSMKDSWVKARQVHCSYHIIEVDSEEFPNYEAAFPSSDIIKPTIPPNERELGIKAPKPSKTPRQRNNSRTSSDQPLS